MLRASPYAWTSQYLTGFFFSYGVYLPFWAMWFKHMGMSESQIGVLIGLGLITRPVSNLVLPRIVHKAEQLIPALRCMSFISLLVVLLHLAVSSSFWGLAAVTILFNLVYAPLVPLSDSLANHYQRRGLLDYGRTRLWGSVAFVIGSWVVGFSSERFGEAAIPWVAVLGLLLTLLFSLRRPQTPPQSSAEIGARPSLLRFLKRGDVWLFIVLVALLQGSHAALYAFASNYWNSVGISDAWVSTLWNIGVVFEILIFIFAKRLFANWSVASMMRLAAVAVAVRWSLMGVVESLPLFALAQSLHSITFAVAHLAAIRHIQSQIDSEQVAWQSLYNALALGLFMGLLSMGLGPIVESMGSAAFFIMASFSVPALLLTFKLGAEPKTASEQ
uniref:3-phenylpropionate MFS transporter n=1 Tax=Thaumasiovibrio occultus TaxID=1891184 RepID=UPI000B35C1AC|nr:3-phenylpropionate MFS transporter [Thaumasiovibrio occultus]